MRAFRNSATTCSPMPSQKHVMASKGRLLTQFSNRQRLFLILLSAARVYQQHLFFLKQKVEKNWSPFQGVGGWKSFIKADSATSPSAEYSSPYALHNLQADPGQFHSPQNIYSPDVKSTIHSHSPRDTSPYSPSA